MKRLWATAWCVSAILISGGVSGCATETAGSAQLPAAATATTAPRPSPILGRKVFDHSKVETGVTKILTRYPPDGYGLTAISGVSCPANQPVITGTTFTCTLTVDGSPRAVTLTVKDDDGKYEVAPPVAPPTGTVANPTG